MAGDMLKTVGRYSTISSFSKRFGLLIVMAILVLFFYLRTPVFLSMRNIDNLLVQISMLLFVSLGQTILMIGGEFDLSIGNIVALTGIILVDLMNRGSGTTVALLVGLGLPIVVSALNASLIAFVGISAFLATFAMSIILLSITMLYSGGASFTEGLTPLFLQIAETRLLFLPLPIVISIIGVLGSYLLIENTMFGFNLYAIGGSVDAARACGLNEKKEKIKAFVVHGLLVGIAAIIAVSRFASANPNIGGNFVMDSFAASFLGMAFLKSGKAHILGAVFGALLIGIMTNGLTLMGTSYYVQKIIVGSILLLGIIIARPKTNFALY